MTPSPVVVVPVDDPLEYLETEICAPYAAAYCESLSTCHCTAPRGGADCTRATTITCLSNLLYSLAPRVLGADADAAAACVEQWSASVRVCTSYRPPVCDRIFVPDDDLEIGDPCPTDGSVAICARGNGYCEWGFGPTPTCTALPGAGQPCSFVCAGAGICSGGVCTLPRSEGERCFFDECRAPLTCISGICQTRGAEGTRCDELAGNACGAGLFCRSGQCAPIPDTCGDPAECGSESYCSGTASTECRARAAVGEACSHPIAYMDKPCVDGAYCDGLRCVALPTVGQYCGYDIPCAAGLVCNAYTSVCAEPPRAGAACEWGLDGQSACGAGLGCVAGRCSALPGEGGACTDDGRCGEGLRCAYSPRDGRSLGCQPRVTAGGGCVSTSDCEEGLVCNTATGRCDSGGAGRPCWDSTECGSGLACIDGSCSAPRGVGSGCTGYASGECGGSGYCGTTIRRGRCISYLCGF